MPELTPRQYAKKVCGNTYHIFCTKDSYVAAGYISVTLKGAWSRNNRIKIFSIIEQLFGTEYITWNGPEFWFKTKEDAVMFKLMYNGP